MISKPDDRKARQEALNIQNSYIVQAPAGSGKTELLIQRYLKLLAHVERPEQILAMTFTRKAAGEMKSRVLSALKDGQQEAPPHESHKKITWKIARQVLSHNKKQEWRIQDNPHRLKIQTIDSFCASLTKQTPLLSGMGSLLEVEENSWPIYREAAHRVLALVEQDSSSGRAVKAILQRLDNSKSRFLDRIVQLLNKRDQWMISFFENADEYRSREDQKRLLSELVESSLIECDKNFSSSLKTRFIPLLRYSGKNVATNDPDNLLSCLSHLQTFPEPSVTQLDAWKAITSIILTSEGKIRKKIDKKIGFPADKNDVAQSMKEEMQDILDELSESMELVEGLANVKLLPNPRLSDEEWAFLENMLQLFPEIDKILRKVFAEQGKTDFSEISLSALKALRWIPQEAMSEEEFYPSDLLLKLDSKLDHILVDEFQDTSFKQIALLKLLTMGWEPEKNTLFLVGDPMQSIYRFRDAEVGLFIQAKKNGLGHIPLKKLQLSANFRSQKSIVDWVNQCFSKILPENDEPSQGAIAYKSCYAEKGESIKPGVALHPAIDPNSDEEARKVVHVIQDIRSHYPDDSIAILVRARPHLLNIVPLLQKAGIQFRAEEIDPLTSRPAILDLLALMRALISPLDRVSWLSVLRAPWCGLSLEDLYCLCRFDSDSSIWELLNNSGRYQQLSADGQQRVDRLVHTLEPVLNMFPTVDFRDLLEGCWIQLGGPACIDRYTLKDIQVFFDKVTEVVDGASFDNLHNFESILQNLFANPSTGEGHAVQIMTIHKAKGLEFDFVLLPGLGKRHKSDEKQLIHWVTHGDHLLFAPISQAGEKDSEIYEFLKRLEKVRTRYEARRLLYVAATRTKKQLHLFGHTQETKEGIVPPSPSSLMHLWDFVADEWEKEHACLKPSPKVSLEPENEAHCLQRLPVNFTPPDPFPDIQTKPALDISEEEEVPFEWAGTEARCLGNVLHRLFETIVNEGLDQWNERRAEQMAPVLKTALLAEGISPLKLEIMTDKGIRAIQNILKDEYGRKILKRYEIEDAELALSYTEGRSFRTKIVDRTFVDDEGIRWIIDYKTGERSGGDIEGFFQQEIERYQSQLDSYEQLIRLHGETRPIKKALYYPLHQRLIFMQ